MYMYICKIIIGTFFISFKKVEIDDTIRDICMHTRNIFFLYTIGILVQYNNGGGEMGIVGYITGDNRQLGLLT